MSSSRDLISALKVELKAAGLTYADAARHLGMAESSVKRMFAAQALTQCHPELNRLPVFPWQVDKRCRRACIGQEALK